LQEIASDFRGVSASNRDLEEMVREGKFREDLLFRLRASSVRIPPLRERVEDIQALAAFYMNQLCKKNNIELKEFSPEIMEVFKNYAWPGNVRELINALESALVNGKNEKTLVPIHLPTAMRALFARSAVTEKTVLNRPEKEKVAVLERAFETIQEFRDKAIADAEEKYLNRLLLETGGDMREMTRFSGLSRSRLYSLFKKYGLKLEH
jgi:two-component system NtrC family response regulator